MRRLIYRSTAAPTLTRNNLEQLVAYSAHRNRDMEITSALLFDGNNFLHTLEGGRHIVDLIYKKISRDTRHSNVEILSNKLIDSRIMPYWSLRLLTVEPDKLQSEPFQNAASGDLTFANDNLCQLMLREFKCRDHPEMTRAEARYF